MSNSRVLLSQKMNSEMVRGSYFDTFNSCNWQIRHTNVEKRLQQGGLSSTWIYAISGKLSQQNPGKNFSLLSCKKRKKYTHIHTHRRKTWPNKVGLSSESTVNSICTTGHSRGSFLSTLCSPVIRSFLRLTVRWRDGLLAGRTQGPIHSKPQSQSTSGIQKKGS